MKGKKELMRINGDNALRAAKTYAKNGWKVIALAPNNKLPRKGTEAYKDATGDVNEIERLLKENPDANIGIATGQVSGIVVVDIDIKNGAKGEESAAELDLPDTLEARTPSGGRHLYYQYPRSGAKVGRKINWRPGIDLLGDKGYVVASPSVTTDGIYEWLNERTCAPLPDEFFDRPATATEEQVLQLPVVIPQGERNTRLFKLGCCLGAQGEEEITILQALREINLQRCDPPLEDSEVARIAKSAASYDTNRERGQKSVVSLIVSFLDGLNCELFHTPDRQTFISFEKDGHRETWSLHSEQFKNWLCAEVYRRHGKSPTRLILEEALNTVSGKALFQGPERDVHLRVAQHDGDYYIDLCNDQWQAVWVSAGHWEIINDPPVRFRRTEAMRSLPTPKRGGTVDDLLKVMNLRAEDLPMVVTFILDAFRPDTPYPVLELTGVQGSAKSTTQDRIRQLIDPNQSNLRTEPKSEEDIVVAAKNNHVVSYNNLSNLSKRRQDVLCSLSTGGGYAARKFYTNSEEFVFEIKRPVMINGISSLATNQDLVDRVVSLELPPIDPRGRRTEQELEAEFLFMWPDLFGAILDAFAGSLQHLPKVTPKTLPRMADFYRLGIAVCEINGWEAFGDIYKRKRRQTVLEALESSPAARAVVSYMEERVDFEGTFQSLLHALSVRKSCDGAWPRTPKGLSDALSRQVEALKSVGIIIKKLGHTREGSKVRITKRESRTHRHNNHNDHA